MLVPKYGINSERLHIRISYMLQEDISNKEKGEMDCSINGQVTSLGMEIRKMCTINGFHSPWRGAKMV